MGMIVIPIVQDNSRRENASRRGSGREGKSKICDRDTQPRCVAAGRTFREKIFVVSEYISKHSRLRHLRDPCSGEKLGGVGNAHTAC